MYRESDHGFVGSDKKGLKCLTCKFNVHNCCHVKFIEEKLDQDDEDLPDVVYEMRYSATGEAKTESKPRCLSDKPILFHPPPYIQRVLCSSFYSSLPQSEGNLLMAPELRRCFCPECGSPWSSRNPIEESWSDKQILLFTINKVYSCTSKYLMSQTLKTCQCTACYLFWCITVGIMYEKRNVFIFLDIRCFLHFIKIQLL